MEQGRESVRAGERERERDRLDMTHTDTRHLHPPPLKNPKKHHNRAYVSVCVYAFLEGVVVHHLRFRVNLIEERVFISALFVDGYLFH